MKLVISNLVESRCLHFNFLSTLRSKYCFIDSKIRQVLQVYNQTINIKNILKH